MLAFVKNLRAYKSFIFSSIQNDFFSRFAQSQLGGLWLLIHPLAQVAIYALILSNVLSAKLPNIDNSYAYALYLMAGILAWSLFSEIITRFLTLFIENANLLKKMQFPRITLPVIALGSCILNNILLLFAILVIFTFMGHTPTITMLSYFPLMLLIIALAVGFGLILGVFNVFIRDIGQATPVILQIFFFFTPIIYPVEILSDSMKELVQFNPMYSVVDAYHTIFVYNQWPDYSPLIPIVGLSVGLLMLGLFLFRRATPEMVDVL